MNTFYSDEFEGNKFRISGQESNHLSRVLRLRKGDQVNVINESGILYSCRVTDATPSQSVVEVISSHNQLAERRYRLHIAIAPTKSIERMGTFVEKCVEMGIDEITPIVCERSERRKINPDRIERIILAARKQSAKAFPTIFNPMTGCEELIKNAQATDKYIATCNDLAELPALSKICKPQTNLLVLIGPEGDFSTEEIERATHSGFIPVNLGSSVLRTETAGIVACSTFYLLNQ